MRLALISDLHASLDALDAVLADADAAGVDRVVCLGDIVDLGPQPAETIERLRARGIPCVKGNHDPLDEGPAFPLLAEIERWTRARLSPEQLRWLEELETERVEDLEGLRVLCVHASPRSVRDQILAETDAGELRAWWGAREFDVLVCGHTHVPLLRRIDDRVVVNVGSVGQPFREAFTGSPPRVLPWSEYAIVGHARGVVSVEHRRLPFDLDALERAMHGNGFPQPDVWRRQWR